MSCWPSAGPTPRVSSSATSGPVVLDASAALALLFEEPVAEMVRTQMRTGVIGAARHVDPKGQLRLDGEKLLHARKRGILAGPLSSLPQPITAASP